MTGGWTLEFQRWDVFLLLMKSRTEAGILADKVTGKVPEPMAVRLKH